MKKLLAVFLSLFTFGCASVGSFFSNPSVEQALAKIAIQQATVRAIQHDGSEKAAVRAKAVVDIIDQAQAVLSNDDDGDGSADHVITSAELLAALDKVLPKDLKPEDKLLIAQLSELLIAEVSASLPAEQQNLPIAEISVVLGWVREAAAPLAPQV